MSVTNIANLAIRVQYQEADKAKAAIDRLAGSAPKASSAVDKLRDSFDRMGKSGQIAAGIVGGMALGTVLEGIAGAATGMVSKMIDVAKETQTMEASLETLTGSAGNAAKAFEQIEKFATTTPFSLQQVAQAFIKLKALGLDPSEAALKSYGNTAAAMGKDVMQFIEAVADASTGEFERLKEFGIRASKEGDNVKFTFQGVTTTVKNNSEEIQKYLRSIGDVQFSGAMDRQMKTIGGAIANMGDAWDRFIRKLGQTGFIEGITLAIRGVTAVLETLSDNINTVAAVLSGAFAGGVLLVSRVLLSSLVPALAAATVGIKSLTMWMLRNPMTFIFTGITVAVGYAVEAMLDFKDEVGKVAGRAVSLAEIIGETWIGLGNIISLVLAEALVELKSTLEVMGGLLKGLGLSILNTWKMDFSFQPLFDAMKANVDTIDWSLIFSEWDKVFDADKIAKKLVSRDPPARDTSGGKGDGDGGSDKDKVKEKAFDRRIEQIKEEIGLTKIQIDNFKKQESEVEKLLLLQELRNLAIKDEMSWTAALEETTKKLVDQYVNQNDTLKKLNDLKAAGKNLTDEMMNADEKQAKIMKELDDLLKQRLITLETYNRKVKELKDKSLEDSREFGDGITRAMNQLKAESEDMAGMAEDLVLTTFNNMSDGIHDFVTGAKSSFSDFARSILDDIARIATRMALLQMFNYGVQLATGAAGGGGGGAEASGPPVDLGAGSGIYAKGGVHTAYGPAKLYAKGGVAHSPQVAIFGEGSQSEAFVPLPDNRSIPVTLSGNTGGSTQVINQINTTINASGDMSPENSKEMAAQFNAVVEAKWDQKMASYQRASANRRLEG